MEIFAKLVKQRSADLGMSQAEVARRAGVSERSFGHYMSSRSEPNLDGLVRIAKVLGTTPNHLLGVEPAPIADSDDSARIRTRIGAACATLDPATLPLVLTLVEAVLDHKERATVDVL